MVKDSHVQAAIRLKNDEVTALLKQFSDDAQRGDLIHKLQGIHQYQHDDTVSIPSVTSRPTVEFCQGNETAEVLGRVVAFDKALSTEFREYFGYSEMEGQY